MAGNVTGLTPGVYRYESGRHRLQMAAAGDHRDAVAATSLADYDWLRRAAVMLVLSGLDAAAAHFADQPPYGMRGPRYVWLAAGCGVQNVFLWAAGHDLRAVLVGGFDDEALRGLDPNILPARHDPLALLAIGHPRVT